MVERLNMTGEEVDVCSDRLETELARLSLVLSLPSLSLGGDSLSLSVVLVLLPSCLVASSVAVSSPAAEAMAGTTFKTSVPRGWERCHDIGRPGSAASGNSARRGRTRWRIGGKGRGGGRMQAVRQSCTRK